MKKTIAVILIILCILSIGTVVFGTEVTTLENNNKNDYTNIYVERFTIFYYFFMFIQKFTHLLNFSTFLF